MTAKAFSDEYYRELAKVADAIGADVADLALALYVESDMFQWAANRITRKNPDGSFARPDPEDPTKGYPQAVGPNQINEGRWRAMGYTNEAHRRALLRLSQVDGLRYVKESFLSTGTRVYASVVQFYLANLAPAYVSHYADPTFICYPEGSAEEIGNKGISNRIRNDGGLTVGDVMEHLRQRAQEPSFQVHLGRLRALLGKPNLAPNFTPRNVVGLASSYAAKRGFTTLTVFGIIGAAAVLGTAVAYWEIHR